MKRTKDLSKKEMHNYFKRKIVNKYYSDDNFIYKTINLKLDYAYIKIHDSFENVFSDERTDFNKIINDLRKNIKHLYVLYKECLLSEKDYRTGKETYGYKDIDDIESTLLYISDRYYCAFRIKWLIDLIENNYYELK